MNNEILVRRPHVIAVCFTTVFAVAFRSGVALGDAGAAGVEAVPAPQRTIQAEWLPYRNAATGLSFRYPPSLRVRERNPHEFGLSDAEEITELLGDTKVNPGTIVLRFIVNRGATTPAMATARTRSARDWDARPDRDSRESLTTMQLDGHEALVAVGCGRAACHWSVHVLQPRDCVILSLLAGVDSEEGDPPPHDGLFPLLSIIRTVRFDTPGTDHRPM